MRAASGREALAVLAELALRDQPVALIVTDQRMPEMTGIEMLGQARTDAPGAKYLLLTAYADTEVAIKAINDIGLDYYLLKPGSSEERLYPVIDDLLGDWRQANPDHTSEVRVVGHRWSDRSHASRCFWPATMSRTSGVTSSGTPKGSGCASSRGRAAELPLVLIPDGDTLRSPSALELAGAMGLSTSARQPLYDVCIVAAAGRPGRRGVRGV